MLLLSNSSVVIDSLWFVLLDPPLDKFVVAPRMNEKSTLNRFADFGTAFCAGTLIPFRDDSYVFYDYHSQSPRRRYISFIGSARKPCLSWFLTAAAAQPRRFRAVWAGFLRKIVVTRVHANVQLHARNGKVSRAAAESGKTRIDLANTRVSYIVR